MAGATPIGNLTYNGITFDGALEIRVTVDAVKDEAEQTIMYHRNTIRAHAVVTNANGTDGDMETIRTKLLEPARQLTFTGKGFGNDLTVGPGDDVRNGPMPSMLSWVPIGANKACEFDWECVACVSKCDNASKAPGKQGGIMSMGYTISWSIDEHGMTTRTISGHILIAQGRNGRKPRDSADKYLNRVTTPQPKGYRRTSSRNLSKDRSRLEFTVTDTQIRSNNPFPEHATEIRGRHRIRWQRGEQTSAFLIGHISIDFSPKKGISGTQAWAYFLTLTKARIEHANKAKGSKCVFLDGLDVEEDLWGTACHFGISYRILGEATGPNGVINGIVSIPGLWQPLDTSWDKWHASMKDVFSLRGIADMQHTPATDLIIDLCEQGTPPSETPSDASGNPPYKKPESPNPYTPDKKSSYIYHRNTVIPSSHRPVVRQSPSQAPDYQPTDTGGASQDGHPTFPAQAGTKDTLQEGGQSRYAITMQGTAQRAGYPINKPVLKTSTMTGVTAADYKEVSCKFAQTVAASSFGVPVYTAVWLIEYMIAGTPGTVKTTKNIAEGLG